MQTQFVEAPYSECVFPPEESSYFRFWFQIPIQCLYIYTLDLLALIPLANSYQIATLTACITLKIQPLRL